jgi:hypothetical protein
VTSLVGRRPRFGTASGRRHAEVTRETPPKRHRRRPGGRPRCDSRTVARPGQRLSPTSTCQSAREGPRSVSNNRPAPHRPPSPADPAARWPLRPLVQPRK